MTKAKNRIENAKDDGKDSDFLKKHRTEWHDFLWNRFLDWLGAKSAEKRTAIEALFSVYEKQLITKRLAALALIRNGVGTREIGRTLWLSRATISALKKSLLIKPRNYRSPRSFKNKKIMKYRGILTKHEKQPSWLDLFAGIDIWELLKNPPRPPGIGLRE